MARIAQVCRVGAPHVGGMERVVHGLSGALVARGHEVEVFTLDVAPDGEALADEVIDGVQYRRLPALGPRRYPFALGLARAVGGFDLVHVHGLDGLADQLTEARPTRVGISTHGGYFHTPRHALLKEVVLRTRTRRTLRLADAVWYTSEADQGRLAAAGVSGRVLPNGVDTQRFARAPRAPEPGRWLVFGRVDVHKGLDDLLRALHLVAGAFHVDVVGPEASPGLVGALTQRAASLGLRGRVVFHGGVDEARLLELVGRAELALFPSRYEGFGLTVVELMAAGLTPVVGPIPAFDELVTPGVDGWRVRWTDPGEAAEWLTRLRGGAHSAMGEAARRRADDWSWSRRVLEHEAAYDEVLRCVSA